ncbi:MAG: class I SAM-dependent methyltransferase [Pseudomonadota bacterium]|nr:class I SAM-dependent methyltransferase [Pseudomonadota bacterium]
MPRTSLPSGDRSFTPALGKAWLTPLYDAAIAILTRESAWRDALVRAADLKPFDKVIDVGSGTGTLLRQMMSSCPPAELLGVEPDPDVLAIAKKKFGSASHIIQWHNGFLDTLNLDRGWQPNKIISSLVLHQVPPEEKRAILEQIAALLKPGGMVLIADYMRQESPLMRRLFRLTVQQLDGLEDTQPNADGLIEEHLQEIFEDAERLRVFPTATGAISLWCGYSKKVPNS